MKPPILLKNILDIAFYLLIALATLFVIVGIVAVINPEAEFIRTATVSGGKISDFSVSAITFSLLWASAYITAFIIAIYHLRLLVSNFLTGKIFTELQVKYLNRIGILVILTSIANLLFPILKGIFSTEKLRINLGISADFGSFWFSFALGLFFIFLSEVFEKARLLKEDQDYTI